MFGSRTSENKGGWNLVNLFLDSEGHIRRGGSHGEKVKATIIGTPKVLKFEDRSYPGLFEHGAMSIGGPNTPHGADAYLRGDLQVLKDTPEEYLAVLPFQYCKLSPKRRWF